PSLIGSSRLGGGSSSSTRRRISCANAASDPPLPPLSQRRWWRSARRLAAWRASTSPERVAYHVAAPLARFSPYTASLPVPGLRMCATLTAAVFALARPTYSSICFGGLPAATMRVGWMMCSGMEPRDGRRGRKHGRLMQGELAETRAHVRPRRDRDRELDVGL